MNNLKVTIITASLNSENTIRQTIESVLNQTYSNIEYIIIDGDSTDNTVNIIQKYQPLFNGRLRYISENDNGIYDGMNKGIRLASGDIIGIINSDDWYEKGAVENVVACFNYSNPDIVYGRINSIYENGRIEPYPTQELHTLWYQMAIAHPAVFLKRSIYHKYGYFDVDYRISADYELMLRLFCNNLRFVYIDNILANFRLGGISQTNRLLCRREGYAISYKYINFCPYKEKILPILNEEYRFFKLEEILLSNPNKFVDMIFDYFANKLSQISIWGVGYWGKLLYSSFEKANISINYFIDNRAGEIEKICNKRVISPKDIKNSNDYILIAVRQEDISIIKQLKEQGVEKYVSIGQLAQKYIVNVPTG